MRLNFLFQAPKLTSKDNYRQEEDENPAKNWNQEKRTTFWKEARLWFGRAWLAVGDQGDIA